MAPSKNSATIFEKVGVYGLIASLVAAAIIAALSLGGVLNMSTVKIFLVIAALVGSVGIILAAVWHSRLREWIRSTIAVVSILVLTAGLWWLYGWIEKNGHRPSDVPPIQASNTPTPTSKPASSPRTIQEVATSAHKPIKTPVPSVSTHAAAKLDVKPPTTDHLQESVQQRSDGPNSPTIVTNGPNSPVTTGPNSPISVTGDLGLPVTRYSWQGWKTIQSGTTLDSIGPVDKEGWEKINVLARTQHWPEVADLCSKERKAYPEWIAPWVIGAHAALNTGNKEQAKELLNHALKYVADTDTDACAFECKGIIREVQTRLAVQ